MTDKISAELKKLVLWRLEIEVPSNFKLSIGNKGTFTKEELKQHIEKGDEIGRIYVDTQLKFMKALVSGELTKILAEAE